MKKMRKALFIMSLLMLFCLSPIFAEQAPSVGPGWQLVLQGKINWATNVVGFVDEKNGITVGANGECHYSNDGGKTWPRGNNQSTCRFGMDILDNSTAWSCGNIGNVRVTKDGGKNWDKITDCGFRANFISFSDITNGWIGSSTYQLVATHDGGLNWSSVNPPRQTRSNGWNCFAFSDNVLRVNPGN